VYDATELQKLVPQLEETVENKSKLLTESQLKIEEVAHRFKSDVIKHGVAVFRTQRGYVNLNLKLKPSRFHITRLITRLELIIFSNSERM
jgi:hypothetical protein